MSDGAGEPRGAGHSVGRDARGFIARGAADASGAGTLATTAVSLEFEDGG